MAALQNIIREVQNCLDSRQGLAPGGPVAVKLGQSDDLHGPHPLPALCRIGRGGGIALLRPRLVAGEQWLAPGRGGGLFPGMSIASEAYRAPRPSTGPFLQLSEVPWRRRCHAAGATCNKKATDLTW